MSPFPISPRCSLHRHFVTPVGRQAKENTARSGLTAIAMARQAALLLLTVHGYEIPDCTVSNDFYRQALKLDLRGKREYTETMLTAMLGTYVVNEFLVEQMAKVWSRNR